MFSIARYQGNDEDEQQDHRTLDKKQERLNKILEKVNKKRKQPEETRQNAPPASLPATEQILTDPTVEEPQNKQKKKKNKSKKNKGEEKQGDQDNLQQPQEQHTDDVSKAPLNTERSTVDAMDTTEDGQLQTVDTKDGIINTEQSTNKEEEEEEEEEEQKSAAIEAATTAKMEEEKNDGLEVFPDIVTSNKHTKEDIQLLRNMGIPEWLLQPTVATPEQTCGLDQVGLSRRVIQRCEDQGLSSFFAVQMTVIPAFLRRQSLYDSRRAPGDLCISAPTGSGKTLSYVLPIVDILSKRVVTRLRALIILPTRDLVVQVKETFDAFVKGTDLKVGIALGQHSFAQEQSVLVGKYNDKYDGGQSKVDILIATPGRLMDHLKDTPNFTLQHLRFLVIDEADRLLNQSYQDWLNHILQASLPQTNKEKKPLTFKTDAFGIIESDGVAPSFMASCFDLPTSDIDLPKAPTVQKLLFSATLTKDPGKIAGLHLTDPEYISVQRQSVDDMNPQYTTPAGLKEYKMVCASDKKPLLVIYLLRHLKIKSGLCFTKSVESTRRLQTLLATYAKQEGLDLNIVVYSSDLKSSQRKQLLTQFKEGQIDLMICSDLIGRGIDLDCVQVVISYDIPLFMDKYIHRVGRTARAGREGQAYTLIEKQESRYFKEMLKKAGHYQQLELLTPDKDELETLSEGYQTALAALSEQD